MTRLLSFFRGWILKRAAAMIATKLAEDPAVAKAIRAYWTDEPLPQVIAAYVRESESASDDRLLGIARDIEAMLKKQSLRALVKRYLGAVNLPDLDGDPSNDISLPDAIDSVAHDVFRLS